MWILHSQSIQQHIVVFVIQIVFQIVFPLVLIRFFSCVIQNVYFRVNTYQVVVHLLVPALQLFIICYTPFYCFQPLISFNTSIATEHINPFPYIKFEQEILILVFFHNIQNISNNNKAFRCCLDMFLGEMESASYIKIINNIEFHPWWQHALHQFLTVWLFPQYNTCTNQYHPLLCIFSVHIDTSHFAHHIQSRYFG